MRTLLILSLVLFGCSDDKTNNTPPADAAIDTPAATPPLALDCATYCTHLAADCKDADAQLNPTNCMGTCMAFPPGTQADQAGNTLGCRNYHLQNIEVRNMPAAMHCPHAGPIGGQAAGGTVCGTAPCDDFCEIQTKVCGTNANPVTGVAADHRYADLPACKAACGNFTKTPEASPTVQSGNTFACRIYHLTNAAAQTTAAGTNAHCGHTMAVGTDATILGPCAQ